MLLFTHDIDWLNPMHPASIGKKMLGKQWLSWKQILQKDAFLRNLEMVISEEAKLGINALNLIGIQSIKNTLSRIGIRYAYNSSFISECFSICKQFTQPCGLHINQLEPISFQVEQFVQLYGNTPLYFRSHYFIKLSQNQLEELWNAGVRYDLSAGKSTHVGIIPSFSNHPMENIPTVVSDNNFFRMQDDKQVIRLFEDCLASLKQSPQVVAILFHPENLLIYPELKQRYLEIIDIVKKSAIQITTAKTYNAL